MQNYPVRVRATKLSVHETAFVAPNATLVGEVSLAKESSVWFGAVLRGDIEPIVVGAESNIQDNCVLHTDFGFAVEVGRRVTVGHGAVLHGCVVEDDCLVAMHATVLTGARIGAGSFVAAGAVVREGMVVPPRSLVAGVPAVVKGPVPDALFARITGGARHYVEYARAYRAR